MRPNVGGWRWTRPDWRRVPCSGKRIIRCLAGLTLLSTVSFGCATTPGTSRYHPTIPARPEFTVRPLRGTCSVSGQAGECITVWGPDWQAIGAWSLTLERELRASCLALGGTPTACGTGP